MRRLLLLSAVVVVAVLAAWLLWPADVRPPHEDPATQASPQHTFTPVAVHAQEGQSGLTLTGTVFDPAGKPVSGAEVLLAASGQQSLSTVRCSCGEPLLSCHALETGRTVSSMMEAHHGELAAAETTRSDAQGRFRFERLVGTSFTVWARAAGFGLGVKERAAPGDPVELFLAQSRTLAGRLRDEAGQPLAGTVRLTSRRLAAVTEVSADATGHFEAAGLGEGPFFVTAFAPGKLPVVARQAEAGPEPLVMTLQTPRRLEVRLMSQGKPIEGLVRLAGDHLTRAVPAKDGFTAIEGLYPGSLLVSGEAGELCSSPQEASLDSLVTRVTLNLDKGGRLAVTVMDDADQPVVDPTIELFTLAGEQVLSRKLKAGELALLGPMGVGQYSLRGVAEGYEGTVRPVVVKPGETQVELVMPRATVITGKVIDEYGRPAPGVSVLIVPTGETVLANAEGRFVAAVPSPGLYTLHAHHSDWGGGELKVTAPKRDVELQLEPKAGAAITVSANGRRVEGATAVLFYAEGSFRSDRPSGADGVVMMRGLPPGEYSLVATHPDYLPTERQQVKLDDGQLLKVSAELHAGAAITGKVVDTLGAPVPGVTVAVMPRGAEPSITDGNGAFGIKPLRPNGLYALKVVQRGYDQVDRTMAKAGGDPVTITVRRQPIFKGRVLSEGAAVKNYRVDEFEVNAADGRFELPLPATEDRVIIAIQAPGYEPLMIDRPNTPDLGDFDLVKAPQISGVVVDEGAAPVADAVVSCDTCEQSVLTGPDGRFMLGKPPYQREMNVLARKGRRTGSRAVSAESTVGIELVLKPGVRVFGSASLPDGRPAAGVEIAGIHAERSDTVSAVTGQDGTYSMDVAPGPYRFVLALPGSQLNAADPPAIIAEVVGPETRLDFGPVPGLGSLTVHLKPEAGFALWLVRGEPPALGNPPLELLKSAWAELIYQPRVEAVTFSGLAPGPYTLVWSSFHAEAAAGPVVQRVVVPGTREVSLVR